jgi:hypothetical protein
MLRFAKHDYSLFSKRFEIHRQYLAKPTADRNLSDTGDLIREHRLFWAMLANKA